MEVQLFAAALAEVRNPASSARRALPFARFYPVEGDKKELDSQPQLKGRNTALTNRIEKSPGPPRPIQMACL
jgi:hypothetical protein